MEKEFYIFLRKRKEDYHYGVVSCFPKGKVAYWGGRRYLMLKEKHVSGERIELFRHQKYINGLSG